jgi:Flp pilus assembly pilin Flp
MKRFWDDDRGAEMVEWAVVSVILLVATVPVLLAMRGFLITLYREIFDALQDPPPNNY